MTEPILDFHTHAQNVYGMCCVPPPLRPVAKYGLAKLYEKTGFNPALKKAESPLSMQLIVREVQSRFATFDFDDYLKGMAANGVTHACALPVEPMASTSELLAKCKGHPNIIPFASVDFDSGSDVVEQLQRHLAAGCRGLKLHPIMQHFELTDPRLLAIFEFLSREAPELPVIFHTGRMHYFLGAREENPEAADPVKLLPIVKRFSKQPIVFGHMGLLADSKEAMRIAEEHANVYLEISFQPLQVVREAIARLGSERLLLGSDWPASETKTEISIVRKATQGDKQAERNILFDNGARLVGLASA
jgi:predicted TIM-barrel fold metal-dependent hydrolase